MRAAAFHDAIEPIDEHFRERFTDGFRKFTALYAVIAGGQRVAEFMLEHNVGVTVAKTYELKEVSNDFFDEDDA